MNEKTDQLQLVLKSNAFVVALINWELVLINYSSNHDILFVMSRAHPGRIRQHQIVVFVFMLY